MSLMEERTRCQRALALIEVELETALRDPLTKAAAQGGNMVYAYLLYAGPAPARRIATDLRLGIEACRSRLKRLISKGLVVRMGAGLASRYHAVNGG